MTVGWQQQEEHYYVLTTKSIRVQDFFAQRACLESVQGLEDFCHIWKFSLFFILFIFYYNLSQNKAIGVF